MRRPPAATAANLTARTRATRFDLAVLTAVAGFATLVIIVTSLETPIRAHDLERTAVTLTIEADGRFDLLVENDPSWLLLRLERFGTGTTPDEPTGSLSPAERNTRLTALAPVFIDRVVLFVDGHEVRPESATYVPPDTEEAADGRPARAAYRLRGSLPSNAHVLRWYYGLVIDPYPMTIHRADGRDVSELVLGDAWSGPLDLAGPFEVPSRWQVARPNVTRGFLEFLPRGTAYITFVLALVVGAIRRSPSGHLAAFVVSFSVGLSVDALGLIRAPLQLMDLLVGLSIVYVGFDNLLAWRWSVAPIALAGLVDGARLARSALDASTLRDHPTTALLALNLGAVAGELTVILIGLVCLASYRRCPWYRNRVVVPTSIALACAGVYWLVRTVAA